MTHPSGRTAAVSAIIELAIEEANDDSGWSYRSGIERDDVERKVREYDADPSTRTIDRALKDCAAMGWLEDRRQGWDPGEKAEGFHPAVDLPGDPVE